MYWYNIGRGPRIDGQLRFGKRDEDLGPRARPNPAHIALEVSPESTVKTLRVSFGGEDNDWGLHIGLGFLYIYLGFCDFYSQATRSMWYRWAEKQAERNKLGNKEPRYAYMLDPFQGRSTGLSWYEGNLSLDIWRDDSWGSSGCHRKWPWEGSGWHIYLGVVDWFIGPTQYEHEVVDGAEGYVTMPEGRYPCTFKVSKVRWNRRWWNGPWMFRGEVDVPGGVPMPGKGENSWDCEDDASYAMSFEAEHRRPEYWELHKKFALSVLETRARRGSLDWKPKEGWPAHKEPG